jgi:hypothetical protein
MKFPRVVDKIVRSWSGAIIPLYGSGRPINYGSSRIRNTVKPQEILTHTIAKTKSSKTRKTITEYFELIGGHGKNRCLEREGESVDDGAENLQELPNTVKMLRLVHESSGINRYTNALLFSSSCHPQAHTLQTVIDFFYSLFYFC